MRGLLPCLFGRVVNHDVNAEDGVVSALKVLQVGSGEAYPLRGLSQLDLQKSIIELRPSHLITATRVCRKEATKT